MFFFAAAKGLWKVFNVFNAIKALETCAIDFLVSRLKFSEKFLNKVEDARFMKSKKRDTLNVENNNST